MPRYRATIWILSEAVNIHEGDAGIVRRVVEEDAESEAMFKAWAMDNYMRSVDDSIWFGPVTEKRS